MDVLQIMDCLKGYGYVRPCCVLIEEEKTMEFSVLSVYWDLGLFRGFGFFFFLWNVIVYAKAEYVVKAEKFHMIKES